MKRNFHGSGMRLADRSTRDTAKSAPGVVALGCLVLALCTSAQARLAVVTPADDQGAPLEYPGELPPSAGGVVPLTWSHVAELVPLVVAGAEVVRGCERRLPIVVDDEVDEALRLMTSLDAEGAVELLDGLVEDLPCLDYAIASSELADIFYYKAAALAFAGDEDGARDAMTRAVAVAPALEPDEALPGKINTILREEKEELRQIIEVRQRAPKEFEIRLDGRSESPELAVGGVGLLQWRDGDGEWQSAVLQDIREPLILGTPIGIEVRLEYPDDPLLLPLAEALGSALVEPMMVEQAVFWDGGDQALLWESDTGFARWLDDDLPITSSGTSSTGGTGGPRVRRDDHLRLTVGGGLTHFDSFPLAAVGGDLSILIYGRLLIALGGCAQFPLTEFIKEQEKALLQGLFHTGLRLRLGPLAIPVHPWLGLNFCGGLVREHYDDALTSRFGGAAVVGADFMPTRHFIIRVTVEGGFLERSGFVHATIGVGFGV